MIRRIIVLAVAASAAVWSLALAQCPPSYVGPYSYSPVTTPIYAAVYRDSSCVPYCLWNAHWDLAAGTAEGVAQSFCFSESGPYGGFGMFLNDDYVLTGPSSPTPIPFTAVMHVTGSAGATYGYTCSVGNVRAALQEGALTSSAAASGTCSPLAGAGLDTDLQLSLAKSVGEHFQLAMTLQAGAACNSLSTLSSRLTFLLPPGYGLMSCQGYVVPIATDVVRTSWGRVKTLYR